VIDAQKGAWLDATGEGLVVGDRVVALAGATDYFDAGATGTVIALCEYGITVQVQFDVPSPTDEASACWWDAHRFTKDLDRYTRDGRAVPAEDYWEE
jgi:hypothetical protein